MMVTASILGAAALAGTVAYGAKMTKDFLKGPELPKAPKQEAAVSAGDEGIRRGELVKENKRRAIGSAYLTQGQTRGAEPLGIGGRQTLG